MRSTWLSLPPELYLKTRPPQFIDQPLATLLFNNWVASSGEVWGNAAMQPGYRAWVALYWWIDMVVYWCLGLVVYWVGMCDAISCQALLLSHGSLPLIRLSDTCTNAHHATMPQQYKTLSSKALLLYHVRANQAIWHPCQCAKKQKYSYPGNSLYMCDNCTTTVPTHCQSGDLTPLPMPTVSPHAGMQNINHLILRRTYNTKSGLWPCHKGTTLSYNILCYCNTQLWLTHSLSCCLMSCHTAEL